MNLRLKAICVLSILFSCSMSLAQVAEEIGEGFDRESPEKIAQAAKDIADLFNDAIYPAQIQAFHKSLILANYQHLDPNHDVPSDLLEDAVIFFDANKAKFPNQAYIVVINFKLRSDAYRFFLIDMASGTVEKFHTIHGVGSDKNKDGWAERFGNVPDSGASSLGFIRTAEVYYGKFKRSIRLDGLSKTNSNVRPRAIVFHGWEKAHEKNVIQGLGWGCPAVDYAVRDGILDKIKEGSLMYIGVSKL